MGRVINIVGKSSNVGKTVLIEGLIKVLKQRGYSIATIKHDVHGFDMDYEGKDTYRHRQAGADTVIISSKCRMAMIQEVSKEMTLKELLALVKDKDIVLVEGYKASNLRKIEVLHDEDKSLPHTPKEQLIAVACNPSLIIQNRIKYKEIPRFERESTYFIDKADYELLADCIEKEQEVF